MISTVLKTIYNTRELIIQLFKNQLKCTRPPIKNMFQFDTNFQQMRFGKNMQGLWNYFKIINSKFVNCTLCNAKLIRGNDNANNFFSHLQFTHPDKWAQIFGTSKSLVEEIQNVEKSKDEEKFQKSKSMMEKIKNGERSKNEDKSKNSKSLLEKIKTVEKSKTFEKSKSVEKSKPGSKKSEEIEKENFSPKRENQFRNNHKKHAKMDKTPQKLTYENDDSIGK